MDPQSLGGTCSATLPNTAGSAHVHGLQEEARNSTGHDGSGLESHLEPFDSVAVGGAGDELAHGDEPGNEGPGGIDTLSDIDDEDVACYIRTEDEAKLKEMVWCEMFRCV